jgi:type VI secretion system secreted protein VgrG
VAGGTSGYSCAVTLIPAERTWRNPAPRPRPTMAGLQTALVTGPEGEEIHCDEYGRIKIHFLWDRIGKTDDGSSCWARVLQPFAGAWGGTWFLPRVGDEVIVGFLDGDPDRPIVVGSVYNSEMMPPFALPSKKTQSGIKTRSSKQGGEDNANILRLDDTKGSEEYYVQAEKDMKVLVKNDRAETIKGKHTETTTKDCSLMIEQGNQSLVISQGNRDTKLDMGNMTTVLSMGNMETKLDLGNRSSKLALGKDETEAMQSIEFKVGQSSVKIDQTGVTIKGLMIKVEGQIQTEVKGLMVQVNGSAMLKLGGGITMIG